MSSGTLAQPSRLDELLLFGDSITQQAWGPHGHAQVLANLYQRKLDVINRGLSGYNTRWAIPIAREFLRTKAERETGQLPHTRLMLVFFGANDACLEPSPQSITVEEFTANMNTIIDMVASPASPYHDPATRFILLTPPPVDAEVRARDLLSRSPARAPDRSVENTHAFAQAVKDLGAARGLPVLDVWTAINDAAGREGFARYLSDGLHLTPEGYEIVSAGLKKTIEVHFPELHWDAMPMVYPHWTEWIPPEART